MNLFLEGPATLAYGRESAQVYLDDQIYEEGEWSGGYKRYVSVPQGEHKVTFLFATDRTDRIRLGPIKMGSPAFISTGEDNYPSDMIEAYQHRLFADFAAKLPATSAWYKDGELLETRLVENENYMSWSLYGYGNEETSIGHIGSYYFEVIDADGRTTRSETMEVGTHDLLTLGEVLGDESFHQPFGGSRFIQDFEVFYEGDSSARLDIPMERDRDGFQISKVDGIDGRYSGSELRLRLSGYDEGTSVTVRDGLFEERKLELKEGWQLLSFSGNSSNLYFEIEKSKGTPLTVWMDGFRSVRDLRIIKQPMHYATYLGGEVEFSVEAYSTESVLYQWRHDGALIAGATGRTLRIGSVGFGDLGIYEVELQSDGQRVLSRPVELSLAEDLGAAVEMPGVRVTTWGDSLWRVDKSVSIDGTKSLYSGEIEAGETSGIRFDFDFPGSYLLYQKCQFGDSVGQPWYTRGGTEGEFAPSFELVAGGPHSRDEVSIWIDRLSYSPLASLSYVDWLEMKEIDVALREDAVLDELADVDGDGLPNYLEFLFDLSLFEADHMPRLEYNITGRGIELGLERAVISNDEYLLVFEVSDDLKQWHRFTPPWKDIQEDGVLFRKVDPSQANLSGNGEFYRWSVLRIGDRGSGLKSN